MKVNTKDMDYRLLDIMEEGSVCLMCKGTGNDGVGRPCCWCLGQGLVPSIQERHLVNDWEALAQPETAGRSGKGEGNATAPMPDMWQGYAECSYSARSAPVSREVYAGASQKERGRQWTSATATRNYIGS